MKRNCHDHRRLAGLLSGLLLCAWGADPAAAMGPRDAAMHYVIDNITTVEDDAEALVWAVVPGRWYGQRIVLGDITPEPVALISDRGTGNRIIEWRVGPDAVADAPGEGPGRILLRCEFTIREIPIRAFSRKIGIGEYEPESAQYLRFVMPEPGMPTDGAVGELAAELTAGIDAPFERGREIYRWIVANVAFDPEAPASDGALEVLRKRRGDAVGMSALFVALARAAGVPARPVFTSWNEGGLHAMADLLLPSRLWLPVDPVLGQLLQLDRGGVSASEAEAFLKRHNLLAGDPDWAYGNLPEERLAIAVDRNISFHSPSLDSTLTFAWMGPGGRDAHPAAVRLRGFNPDVVHGAFYTIGDSLSDEQVHEQSHRHLALQHFRPALADTGAGPCGIPAGLVGVETGYWLDEGKVMLQRGDAFGAEGAFKRAQRLARERSRDNPGLLGWLHIYLGYCYDVLGYRDLAVEEYDAALALDTDFHGARREATARRETPFALP